MNISEVKEGKKLIVYFEGSIDTTSAPKAYEYLQIAVKGYNHLIEDEGANHYKKVYEETKTLLESEIFDDYRKEGK